jgi:uncharacterized surface protein with fasciclin (FAS1) repeats
MTMSRFFSAAAALALMSGAAMAQTTTPPPAAAVSGKVVAQGDLIETAKASGQFTTLLKALDAANLTSVLKTSPNLTVFAPTDAAFAALPPGQLDSLLQPQNAATLQKLLTYHLINSRVDSSKIKGSKGEVKTVEGSAVMLDGSGATAMIDAASIVQADVMASNGVIHVIDKVLIPGDVPGLQAAATMPGMPGMAMTAPADPTATAAASAGVDTAAATPISSMSPEAQAGLKAGDANVVSNPPVADTPENRAKYGKPMSNAGKRSAAKGN